jgi:hypothetical protein
MRADFLSNRKASIGIETLHPDPDRQLDYQPDRFAYRLRSTRAVNAMILPEPQMNRSQTNRRPAIIFPTKEGVPMSARKSVPGCVAIASAKMRNSLLRIMNP